MKKCSNCHKNIPSDANVCPYCKTPQGGYRPMKRTQQNTKSRLLYYIVAIALFLFPMGFSYYLTSQTLSDYETEKVTLGKYSEVKDDEYIYEYITLKDFKEYVKNSDKYVQKIEDVEKELEALDLQSIEKDYYFAISRNNNVYVELTYTLQTKNNESINVSGIYDLSRKSELEVTYNTKDKVDLKTLTNVTQIFKEGFKVEPVSTVLEEVNAKDSSEISHYGIGSTKETKTYKCSVRKYPNNRTKITYTSSLDVDKFI